MPHIVCVAQHPPYGSYHSKELFDMALAAASFDYQVTVVFLGDGLFGLLKNQAPEAIHQKNHARYLSTLTLFETCRLLVSQKDLHARRLNVHDLVLPVELIEDQPLGDYLSQADSVLML